MPISYNKLLNVFKEKGITSYTITKKEKLIGQSTWKKIHENGHIDTRTIEALCKYLNCQPGDILEYIPDEVGNRTLQERSEQILPLSQCSQKASDVKFSDRSSKGIPLSEYHKYQ